VDQVGRKSETTLGIASLHFEIGAFPGAAPDQFELSPGASNATSTKRRSQNFPATARQSCQSDNSMIIISRQTSDTFKWGSHIANETIKRRLEQ
jgi:hypothetical protein